MSGSLFGGLAKLTILGFLERDDKIVNKRVTALYNPQSVDLTYTSFLEENKAINSAPYISEFRRAGSTHLSLSLICDGALPGNTKSVNDQLDDLTEICCQLEGKKREPRFLDIEWGDMKWGGRNKFRGRVSNFKIAYSLFNRNGSPERATVTLELMSDGSTVVERSLGAINTPSVPTVTVPAMGNIAMMASFMWQFGAAVASTQKSSAYLAFAFGNDFDNLMDFASGDVLLGAGKDIIDFDA